MMPAIEISCGDFVGPVELHYFPSCESVDLSIRLLSHSHSAERHPVPRLLLQLENATNYRNVE
jgi:hypothetical protein